MNPPRLIVGLGVRPEKVLLGKLAGHRGKTVDALIRESVTEHLSRSNYGNTAEIAATLRIVGVDTAGVNRTFPTLDELMRRRHNIVHRADENVARGRGQFRAMTISMATVIEWVDAVQSFAAEFLGQL